MKAVFRESGGKMFEIEEMMKKSLPNCGRDDKKKKNIIKVST